MDPEVCPHAEAEDWYRPYGVPPGTGTPDELRCRHTLVYALPGRDYRRTLHVGCGDGRLTDALPGESVLGVDVDAEAVRRAAGRLDGTRFSFERLGVLQLSALLPDPARFDLIVLGDAIRGVPSAGGMAWLRAVVDDLLAPCGILAIVAEGTAAPRFPYLTLERSVLTGRRGAWSIEVYEK